MQYNYALEVSYYFIILILIHSWCDIREDLNNVDVENESVETKKSKNL